MAEVRGVVLQVLAEVSRTHLEAPLPECVSDEDRFSELGFDSVAYVATISSLEDELGCIPKAIIEDASFPATVGELVMVYQAELGETTFDLAGEANEDLGSSVVLQRG